jgi:hypothetical protein
MTPEDLLARIKSKVKTLDNGCMVWTGSKKPVNKGRSFYGQCWFGGKAWSTHKFFWDQAKGKVPDNLELDHICRNSLCVNVEHLRAVTHSENCRNKAVYDKTHCKCGQTLTINVKGHKICVPCRDRLAKAWKENNRERWNAISRKSYAKNGNKKYPRLNGERVYE